MKIMNSLVKDAVPKVRKVEKAYTDLGIAVFLAALVLAAGLFVLALLFPEELAQAVQEVAAWFLAGTVAALALLAIVKGLEGLLDS
ncbi:MAG: hypothetical protein HHJ16_06360 [Polaromonas sp.]|uniref:hypothetical protein n=1 Tax=Polaromonas sp. TaxID=1869339 RepID=UPI0017D8256E|nr:hypothetical protein [Polaromonas sp.]NMM09878.1 hypothetical protein [Polaromonas sp.]